MFTSTITSVGHKLELESDTRKNNLSTLFAVVDLTVLDLQALYSKTVWTARILWRTVLATWSRFTGQT